MCVLSLFERDLWAVMVQTRLLFCVQAFARMLMPLDATFTR